jgi:hypothetical protein
MYVEVAGWPRRAVDARASRQRTEQVIAELSPQHREQLLEQPILVVHIFPSDHVSRALDAHP